LAVGKLQRRKRLVFPRGILEPRRGRISLVVGWAREEDGVISKGGEIVEVEGLME
jgi:hypothetical protein